MKVIVPVQVAPTATGAAQLVVVTLKSAVLVKPVKLNGAFPSFTSEKFAVAVAVALVSVPKLTEASALTAVTSSAIESAMYTFSWESTATDAGLVTVGAIMV